MTRQQKFLVFFRGAGLYDVREIRDHRERRFARQFRDLLPQRLQRFIIPFCQRGVQFDGGIVCGDVVHVNEHVDLSSRRDALYDRFDRVLRELIPAGHLDRDIRIPVIDGAELHRYAAQFVLVDASAETCHAFCHILLFPTRDLLWLRCLIRVIMNKILA